VDSEYVHFAHFARLFRLSRNQTINQLAVSQSVNHPNDDDVKAITPNTVFNFVFTLYCRRYKNNNNIYNN